MPRIRVFVTLTALLLAVAGASVTQARTPKQGLLQTDRTITVAGRIMIDTGDTVRPVQGLTVELWDRDATHNELVTYPDGTPARTVTDALGRFRFENVSNVDMDGPPWRDTHTGQDIFLKITTEGDRVEVQDAENANKPFAWYSLSDELLGPDGFYPDVPDGSTVTFPDIRFPLSTASEPVRVMETLYKGWAFVTQENGLPDPGRTVARWGRNVYELRYDPDEEVIYLRGGDASYPDVILRLQAVNFLKQHYGSLPAGCTGGGPVSTASTATCAWVDGWGLFFQGAVQNDPQYDAPDVSIDLESQQGVVATGDTVAGRVGGALWDLMDAADDGFDMYTGNFADIWSIYTTAQPTTFAAFWQAWKDAGLPQCEPVAAIYQNSINYNTPPTLSPLADIVLDEDQSLDPPWDMWPLASDAECTDEELLFAVQGLVTNTVSIDFEDNRYLHVNPAPDWHGEVTANVQVYDGVVAASQPLHIRVRSINDPPRIEPRIPDRTVLAGEPIILQLTNNIHDPDNSIDELSLSAVPQEVPLQVPVTVTVEGLVITFTPHQRVTGLDNFDIVVTDPEGASTHQRVFLEWVRGENHPPTISEDLPPVWERHKGETIEMDLLSYASDDWDDPSQLDWSADLPAPVHATVTKVDAHTLRFTPDPADFIGDYEVTLVVRDRDGAESRRNVILRWTPLPNIAPRINPRIPDQEAGINQPIVLDLRGYAIDADDNPSSLRWYAEYLADERHSVVTGQGTRILTFTPAAGFEGSEQVRLVVRDPKGAEDSQVVTLTWKAYRLYVPLILKPVPTKP